MLIFGSDVPKIRRAFPEHGARDVHTEKLSIASGARGRRGFQLGDMRRSMGHDQVPRRPVSSRADRPSARSGPD
jgi:hypothetical protein